MADRVTLFLSYGRRDARELAERLRADLEAHGYQVWQDTSEIRAGTEWEGAIRDGLHAARLVIAILSPHAVRVAARGSANSLDSVCLDEISLARFSQPPKPIVPVMGIPCEPPFCIFRLDYVDMGGWDGSPERYQQGLRRILDATEAALRGEVRYRSWVHELSPWDFGAFLSEKRRQFCGRQWLFDEIDAWRASPGERALLITGDPGTGKSAIVAELVHRNPGGQILAYHCCQADTPATLEPGLFVRSLAAMIASRLDGFAARLSDPAVERALLETTCAQDPASAFEAGILAPLSAMPAPEEGVRYILVDALDEALALRRSARTTIVDLLASRLGRLPRWLRVVATTRKERDVLDRLRGLRAQELNAQDPRNLDDIDRFVELRLADAALARPLSPAQRRLLREKSAGNFLYVQQIFEGVDRGLYSLEDLEAPPPGLYGLYLWFFERAFPDEASFGPVRNLLECVVAAREPLTRQQLAQAAVLDDAALARALRSLAAYLPVRDGRHAIYHKSLADWLTHPDLEGALHCVSRRRGDERLAQVGWEEYRRGVGAMSEYSLRHLVWHLIGSSQWDALAEVLCDLGFVQGRCAAGQTFSLVGDYSAALDAWPGYRRYDPFGPPPSPALPWLAECVAAVRAGAADPHPGAGAGPALASLARRETPLEATETFPLGRSGEALPAALLGGPPRAEPPQGVESQFPGRPDTAPERVVRFSTFVSSYSHSLHSFPRETAALARNHAADGPVAEAGAALAVALDRVWVARDPRPPAPPDCPLVLRVLRGHSGKALGVALTPDGRLAVSGGEDGSLRVWEVVSGASLRSQQGHADKATAVAMTRDGTAAVSSSEDGTLRVWDLGSGQCLRTLEGHADCVSGVAVSAEGTLAASASWDGTLRAWDVATGQCLRVFEGHDTKVTCVALTPDAKVMVSGDWDGTLRVWDVAGGRCLGVLLGHSFWVSSVAISDSGRAAVSAGWDETLRVWDVSAGTCLRVLEGHGAPVTSAAMSADGLTLVSGSYDRTVRVWKAASGECARVLRGHAAAVTGVAAAADASVAVSSGEDGVVRVWNVAHGREVPSSPRHSGPVNGLAATPDGTAVVSVGADQELRLWNASTGDCTQSHSRAGARVPQHRADVFGVAVSPDGRVGVSVGSDDEGPWRRKLPVFDMMSGRILTTLSGHRREVEAVALTPDGRLAVSGSSDETLRVWDLASSACLMTLHGSGLPMRGRLLEDWRKSGVLTQRITSVATTPEGRRAASSTWDKWTCVWDLPTGTCLARIEGRTGMREERRRSEEFAGVALAADGTTAVSAGWDRALRVWSLETGEVLRTLEGSVGRVEKVVITPDGRTAISAGSEATLRVWDLATGRCLRTLAGHGDIVNDVRLTADGRTLVSASDDQTLRVWDVARGVCQAVYHAGAGVTALAGVSLDGRFACGTADGELHLLSLRGLEQGPPVVTAVVLWHFDPVGEAGKERKEGDPLPGHYDEVPTVACPWCANRAPVPDSVLEVIAGVAGTLDGTGSPCTALPAEAWLEARLLTSCLGCRGPLQLNPFVVDRRAAR